jgi:hypothetical protein
MILIAASLILALASSVDVGSTIWIFNRNSGEFESDKLITWLAGTTRPSTKQLLTVGIGLIGIELSLVRGSASYFNSPGFTKFLAAILFAQSALHTWAAIHNFRQPETK